MAFRLTDIPYKAPVVDQDGFISREWDDFFLRMFEVIGANNTTLFSSNFAPTTESEFYTVSLNKTLILDDLSVTNISNSAATITVKFDATTEVNALSIASGATDNLIGNISTQVLTEGTRIFISASAANALVVKANGREVKTG